MAYLLVSFSSMLQVYLYLCCSRLSHCRSRRPWYGLGTIKLLASSPCLREQVASSGVMDLTINTLRVCCQACDSGKLNAGEMVHVRNILIQVLVGKGLWVV